MGKVTAIMERAFATAVGEEPIALSRFVPMSARDMVFAVVASAFAMQTIPERIAQCPVAPRTATVVESV